MEVLCIMCAMYVYFGSWNLGGMFFKKKKEI
jgi:hypothetical protein